MIGSINKLLRNVASLKGKSAFDKVLHYSYEYRPLLKQHIREI